MKDSAACTLLDWLLLKTAMSNVKAARVHRDPELCQFCRVDEIMSVVEECRFRWLLVMAIWLWLSVVVGWLLGEGFTLVLVLLLRGTPIATDDGRPAA